MYISSNGFVLNGRKRIHFPLSRVERALSGDIIEMTFDTTHKTLSYYNNESLGEIWTGQIKPENDNHQYVALWAEVHISGFIELISWSRTYTYLKDTDFLKVCI